MMPRSAIRTWTLSAFAALGLVPAAHAQQRTEPYAAIDGTVVDGTGRGLASVDVVVMDSKQLVRTKATGAYRIDSVAPGPHVLRFRRIGLQPVTVTVNAGSNDVTGVDVVMPSYVYQLATVEVQGDNGDVYHIPREFADRMHGQGIYLTEADIANRHALSAVDIFRSIPGVQVISDGRSLHLASSRGPVTILGSGCLDMPVYINATYGGGAVPPQGASAQDGALSSDRGGAVSVGKFGLSLAGTTWADAVDPTQIIGIEIYRGPSEMPATLPQSPCGAVIVWTR